MVGQAAIARLTLMASEPETKVVAGPIGDANKPATHEPPVFLGSIGRYQLLRRLGHGGMATVYLGRTVGSAGFEKLVAVKVIHPHLGREPEFVEMFLDEARIPARLHHPHVVEILDLGREGEVFYMVMELVEGETLSSLIRQLRTRGEHLPLSAVLQIMSDACLGLGAAHDLLDPNGRPYELVHRDVSPQNLIVGMDGWVKVMDFGVMKAIGKRSATQTGQLRGKLPYMSPEQARGLPVDRRTDVFALGVVLWELCTHERLFLGASDAETLERVMRCEVPPLSTLRPDLPDEVDRLIRRALARDAAQRHRGADELLSELRELLLKQSLEIDPRQALARAMERCFAGRVAYARAVAEQLHPDASGAITEVVRARGHESGSLPTPSDSVSARTPAKVVGRGLAQWLFLPALGAAVATVILLAATQPRSHGPTGAPMPAPSPTARAEVTWVFNTEPQGAQVWIDGDRQDGITPIELTLATSEVPVNVRIEKDGYHPREVQLAPVSTENYEYVLQPRESELPASATPPAAAARTLAVPRVRARPLAGKPASEAPPVEPGKTPAPSGDRKPKPMPDFSKKLPPRDSGPG